MADGPDFAALFALTNASKIGGNGCIPVLAGVVPGSARDVEISSMSLKAGAINGDKPLPMLVAQTGKGGLLAALLKQMDFTCKNFGDGIAQANKAAPVKSINSNTEVYGQDSFGGNRFTNMVSGSQDGGGRNV